MRGSARATHIRAVPPQPREYGFLLDHIDRQTLERAEALATSWGVPPHEVLIANGWLSADAYAAALAYHCGVGFVPMVSPERVAPAPGSSPREGLRQGVLRERGRRHAVLAADKMRPNTLQQMLQHLDRRTLSFTTSRCVRRAIYRHFADHFAESAGEALYQRHPDRSAKSPVAYWLRAALAGSVLLLVAGLAFDMETAGRLVSLGLAIAFLPIVILRLLALRHGLRRKPAPSQPRRIPDQSLPIYTLLVPLLREAEVVGGLTQALRQLDYPAAKLDIKLILEVSDLETRAAVAGLDLPGNFEIVLVPDFLPHTKPKALNFALPLARGDYLVIYDAEDRPERDQLRKAVQAFRDGPPDLACLQAKLNIYNSRDSWLSRQFTIEYSALFDALLPALDHYRLPIPLGGTSNHFRISALKWLQGWDPYNVTEDADLGTRLARLGYRCEVLDSTTYEEAPVALWQWRPQRTRWMKGYLQTWCVHMRHPRQLYRELGLRGFLGFQLMLGGTVLSALVHPWFYILAGYDLVSSRFFQTPQDVTGWPLWLLALFVLASGYAGAMGLGLMAVLRRGQRHLLPQIPLMPAYWLLVSMGAYRAVWQFFTARFTWEKTKHGRTASAPEPLDGSFGG